MRKKDQIIELQKQIDELKRDKQSLLDLAGRFGHENQKLKNGIELIKKAIQGNINTFENSYAINNHQHEPYRTIDAKRDQEVKTYSIIELCDSYLNAK